VVRPIRLITDRMELVAAGKADLTQEMEAAGRDEMSDLVHGFNRSVRSLRDIVRGVHRLGARAVESALAGRAVGRSVTTGTREQVSALERTREAAQALDRATSSIAQATEQLDGSARDMTTAFVGMEQQVSAAGETLTRMNDSINTAASSIGDLGSSIQSINASAEQLGETSEQVSASVAQLDQSLREINRFTEETAVFSEAARDAAEAGREAVSATAEGMNAIEQHTRRVNATMAGLAEVTGEIGDIVEVIQGVAERTNLLALNAAIIAARAGAEGQGFQVVAQEIRELAERTRASTADIGALIARVQRETSEAAQLVSGQVQTVARGRELAADALGELVRIGTVAEQTSSRIGRIVQRADEQTDASRKVLQGVERIREMLSEITRATKEQSQASSAVQRAAGDMQGQSERATRTFAEQAAQIRAMVQTMEKMAARIGGIHQETRAQLHDTQRLEKGIAEVLALAAGFAGEAEKLDGAMARISSDVATLSAEVTRFKIR
jgi:methyl-accepting chemotaxis protein